MKKSLLMFVLCAAGMLLPSCGKTDSADSEAKKSDTPATEVSEAPATEASEAPATEASKTNPFATYTGEQFASEDFTTKTISHQLSAGPLNENISYGMAFYINMNLYADGSVKVDLRNYLSCFSTYYYGAWNTKKDEDGFDALNVVLTYIADVNSDGSQTAVAVKTTKLLSSSSDGIYTWTEFTYSKTGTSQMFSGKADLVSEATIKYATDEAFHEAVDQIVVSTQFEAAITSPQAGTLRVIGTSNGDAKAYFAYDYNGTIINLAKWEGGKYSPKMDMSGAINGYTFDFTEVSGVNQKFVVENTTDTDGNVVVGTFEFTATATLPQTTEASTFTATLSYVATPTVDKDGKPLATTAE